MIFDVVISKKALNDIRKITEYYDKQRDGLGNEFKNVLYEYIEVLETNPNFRMRYDKIRCLPIKIFPYMIHFSVNENKRIAKIHAILHTSRNPKIWNNR